MNKLPKAKLNNIVVQHLNDETLIYNLNTNQAFCLNETAAKVFNACDGITTFAELKSKHQLTDEVIYLALDGLQKENLIAADYVSPFAGLSRREAIKKVGLASMIALPMIAGIVAPSAAAAASGGLANGISCEVGGSSVCRSNNCIATIFVTGSFLGVDDGRRCCVQNGGNRTGTYFGGAPGSCNFASNCCTGTGTDFVEDGATYCTCALTS